jgi:hypothetical protein
MQILIAASSRDLRLARICIASVRHFYPKAEVLILPGAPLPPAFLKEVAEFWDVGVFPVEEGHYGWGFVKLEPLFAESRNTFLILDADTVMAGPVIETLEECFAAADKPDFIVDEEDQPEVEMRRLYYDWDLVSTVDPTTQRPAFVFNSGQWCGKSEVLTRADFDPWVEWTFPRRLKHPEIFMPGDQGILNYVLNQKAAIEDTPVARLPLMKWPGHGMSGFEATDIRAGSAPSRIVHWAGLKKIRFSSMSGGDLLLHFERAYYQRLPNGRLIRQARAFAGAFTGVLETLKTRVRLFWKLKLAKRIGLG